MRQMQTLITPSTARTNVLCFLLKNNPDFKLSQHIILEADLSERECNGTLDGGKGLLMSAPPGSCKSKLFSENLPPWFLGYADYRSNGREQAGTICLTHDKELAELFGSQARDIVSSEVYREVFPSLVITPDTKRKTYWNLRNETTKMRHLYYSRGIYGGTTGRRTPLLIIDDAVKDRTAIATLKKRDNMYRQFTTVGRTRLTGVKAKIIMHTRWGVDDLIGQILRKQGKYWHYLNLPAIAVENEEYEIKNKLYQEMMLRLYGRRHYKRNVGESIWPEHPSGDFDLRRLEELRETMDTADWLALYQGQPIAEGGNMFKLKWLKFLDKLPEIEYLRFSLDTAWKDRETSAYSVMQCWGKFKEGMILLDRIRGRWLYDELKKRVIAYAEYFIARGNVREIIIEEEASGISLCRDLQVETCLPVVGVTCPIGKRERANLIIGYVEAGRVFVYNGEPLFDKPWVHEFLEEYEQFPDCRYKDQMDAFVHALKREFIDGYNIYDLL